MPRQRDYCAQHPLQEYRMCLPCTILTQLLHATPRTASRAGLNDLPETQACCSQVHISSVTQTVSLGGGPQNSTKAKFSCVSFSNQCTSLGATTATMPGPRR